MIRLLTDENFNNVIMRGLTRRLPHLDFVSARDVGLASLPDLILLRWAANQQRIVLTHDVNTMVPDATQLIVQGEPMLGLIVVPDQLEIGRAINDLEIALECYSESDLRDSIKYLPF